MHIKVNDLVKILAGNDQGTTGKVLKVYKDRELVLVEQVNVVFKHMKRSRQNPRGGRLEKEMPVSISNVMLVCPRCNQASRTGVRIADDGMKSRFCKKCKADIGVISKKKTPVAKK
ncbi:MAG: 50S ribosomal protein L24 [Pirellulales bacterium]|nr:50S ribosomal protein L24 [Pirellulales bacterium]